MIRVLPVLFMYATGELYKNTATFAIFSGAAGLPSGDASL